MNNRALAEVEDLIQIKNRLLELCMYALIRDTKIYNHELDDVHLHIPIPDFDNCLCRLSAAALCDGNEYHQSKVLCQIRHIFPFEPSTARVYYRCIR